MNTSPVTDRGVGAAAPQGAGSASAEPIALWVDGQAIRAKRGATLLEAARAAGIHIPTLCHHEATASERVRAARREILDLLLARCPESPLIRRLALEHGIRESSYRRNPEPTDCILCGLCTRPCDHLGPAAISLVGRGIGREVAPPFHGPPPDCVGCLACAVICPTGHIPFSRSEIGHTIWGRTFARLRCPTCGRAHITEAEADFWGARTGIPRADLEKCDACKRAATAETIAGLAAVG